MPTPSGLRRLTRRLTRRRGLTALAVVLLAVGVGAVAFVGATVDAVLAWARPYPDPGSLMDVRASSLAEAGGEGGRARSMTPADYLAFERGAKSFSSLGAYVPFGEGDLLPSPGSADGAPAAPSEPLPERVAIRRVSEGLLTALGCGTEVGSGFSAADYRPGAPPVVMLSSHLWHGRFAADPAIVGATIRLDGEDRLVRGVLPARLRIPGGEADAVLPLHLSAGDADDRSASYLGAIGRLRPGVSVAEARAELAGVAARLARDHPDSNDRLGAHVQPLDEMFTAAVRGPLALLIAAAVLLLLVAGLDLAGLDVVWALDRRRAVAVRLALGAPRSRLVRESVDEAAVVAVGGWLLGLALARVGLAVLPRLQGAYLPSSVEIGLSPAVVLGAAAVATAGAILPALAAARVALRGRGVPLAPWLERGAERRSRACPAGCRPSRSPSRAPSWPAPACWSGARSPWRDRPADPGPGGGTAGGERPAGERGSRRSCRAARPEPRPRL